jgi:hypothetical protein
MFHVEHYGNIIFTEENIMAMQTIINGGFVGEEIEKINANFNLCAEKSEIPTVPTKTSELTNDSGFVTEEDIPTVPTKTSQLTNDSNFVKTTDTAFTNKVDKEVGKGLSTEDYTTAEKQKLAELSAPTKTTFTTNNWTDGTFTTASNGKNPVCVMRKNGSNYGVALVDVQIVGSNIVITADESFEGYLITI